MKVFVEEGRIMSVEGEEKNPNSEGRLCAKGLSAVQLEYNKYRLSYPLKRIGDRGAGKWKRITWDEALDLIQREINIIVDKFSPASVAWHRGTAPRWGSNWAIVRRFMNVFGSPNLATHDHNCHTPRVIGHMYTYGKRPISDYEKTRCILLWGYNPVETHLPTDMRRIMKAKYRGAKLIVIDPLFTKTASKADIFVQLRPGTDGALALGMLHLIVKDKLYDMKFVEEWTVGFEDLINLVKPYTPRNVEKITGVSQNKIQELTQLYASTKPSIIQLGNGVDQHTNVVQTVRAIAIIIAVTGNIDVPGGNILPSSLGLTDISFRERIKDAYEKSVSTHPIYYNEPKIGLVSTPEILDAIMTSNPYPIKALIVQASALGIIGSNTKKVHEALMNLDFLVVHDVFMTTTAELADLVLPAPTFFEQSLLITQPGPSVDCTFLGMINKIKEPLGECLSDTNFIIELAKKLGYTQEFSWKNEEEIFNEELAPIGLTVEQIRKQPWGILLENKPNETFKKFERQGFETPSGKVELYSETFEKFGYDPIPHYIEPAESPVSTPLIFKTYPLICNTGLKPGFFTHTRYRTLPWMRGLMAEAIALIHPKDAEQNRINDGAFINVESPRGTIEVRAKVTLTTMKGVVMVTHGWGQPNVGGAIANILTDDKHRDPICAATGNRSFLCRIKKISR
jgi:anaerobic selenocysteine-containing dehydrogenase